jgi:hypothetical protein
MFSTVCKLSPVVFLLACNSLHTDSVSLLSFTKRCISVQSFFTLLIDFLLKKMVLNKKHADRAGLLFLPELTGQNRGKAILKESRASRTVAHVHHSCRFAVVSFSLGECTHPSILMRTSKCKVPRCFLAAPCTRHALFACLIGHAFSANDQCFSLTTN